MQPLPLLLSDSGQLKAEYAPYFVIFSDGTTYILSGHFTNDEVARMTERFLKKKDYPLSAGLYKMMRTMSRLHSTKPTEHIRTLLDSARGDTLTLVQSAAKTEEVTLMRPFVGRAANSFGTVKIKNSAGKEMIISVTPEGNISPHDITLGTFLHWSNFR